MEFHPIANLLPLHPMPGLIESVKRHGLLEPIITLDGMILDGRQRYTACTESKVAPRYEEYAGQAGDPVSFVKVKNLDRRQLSPTEKAIAAAKLLAYWREELAKRGRKQEPGKGRVAAAAVFGASPESTARADNVLRNGVPELVKAVEEEGMGLLQASSIATLSPEEQLQELVSQDTTSDADDAEDERPAFVRTITRLLNRAKSETKDSMVPTDKQKKQFYAIADQGIAWVEKL